MTKDSQCLERNHKFSTPDNLELSPIHLIMEHTKKKTYQIQPRLSPERGKGRPG